MKPDQDIQRHASISSCGLYRWSLTRIWDASKPMLGWIMLNPSTADAMIDDPTIRRCMGFASDWGYGRLIVRNLFALRSPEPQLLYIHPLPELLGPHPDQVDALIYGMWDVCNVVVAAWGIHGELHKRGAQICAGVAAAGHRLHCLGRTYAGHPRHPLYLPASMPLEEFTYGETK